MSRSGADVPDPDDLFSDTRMTFGEHIEDLRTHLMRAVVGFAVAFVASFLIAKPVLRFIAAPVEQQLLHYHKEQLGDKMRELHVAMGQGVYRDVPPIWMKNVLEADALAGFVRKRFGLKEDRPDALPSLLPAFETTLQTIWMAEAIDPLKADPERWVPVKVLVPDPLGMAARLQEMNQIIRPPTLATLSVQEAFIVFVKVALLTGLVVSSPWVFFQVWSFIAAGLYPSEKRLVNVYLPVSLGLFLGGVFVCEFLVLPKAIEALLWFNKILGLQPDLRLSEWLGFAIFMPLVFGISFQTPLVMFFTERIGIFSVEGFREKRRLAWFLMAIFTAVITPSTDAVSMLMLLVPMGLLYELGIYMCIWNPRQDLFDSETEESEDIIEV